MSDDPLDSAYRLLLARFGIAPEEAPVVRKTEREIVFHSKTSVRRWRRANCLGWTRAMSAVS
ncbi:MAG: hypothetical protein R2881_04175 [Eubacteriales bacterium]